MIKHDSAKLILSSCLLSLLVACGSTPTAQKEEQTNVPQEIEEAVPVLAQNPLFYVEQAKVSEQSGDTLARDQWLLRAAEAYKQQNQCQQSRKIVALSQPILTDLRLKAQSQIIHAECIVEAGNLNTVALTGLIDSIDPEFASKQRLGKLRTALLIEQKRWIEAAKTVLMSQPTDKETTLDVWYLLQNLSAAELERARLQEPELQAWLQLSLIVQAHGFVPDRLQTEVNKWQKRFISHPLSNALPEELRQLMALELANYESIAVMLPLSGRLSQQGLAIKEGLLAAYFASSQADETSPKLVFIDTQVSDAQALADLAADYDMIIGPLLKDTLTEFLALVDDDKNVIGLNQIDMTQVIEIAEAPLDELITQTAQNVAETETLPLVTEQDDQLTLPEVAKGERIFFALSPEDEAMQLAQIVYQQGIAYPIVISHQSGAAKRMADAFLQTWQVLQGADKRAPGVATFADNESMRNSLTSLLDVAQSKSRIKQIDYLTSISVQSVPRNRRDIDAIILFASPEQTELLNPIIESSLSPFNNKAVPVFASSRSYSLNLSNNSLRDLRNLTFTDMPFMLPDHDWQDLQQSFVNIWPDRNDTLRRLFSLGYDAYSLIAVSKQLRIAPQLSVKGLTGRLSIDQNGVVIRALPLGQIAEDKVILVAMD